MMLYGAEMIHKGNWKLGDYQILQDTFLIMRNDLELYTTSWYILKKEGLKLPYENEFGTLKEAVKWVKKNGK